MNIKKTLKEVYKNINICGNSSVDRALAFQAGSCGFEPRLPLKILLGPFVYRLGREIFIL